MRENNNIHKGYSSPLPYPDIKVMEPNKYYAKLLMEDYTGMVSELTAINQYSYHSFVVNNDNKDLVKLFEMIAVSEMRHLEILAQLIKKLGSNPIYSSQNNFWNGSYVYYGNNLCDQLESDLESEYSAISNYQRHIRMIQDPYIQSVLKRIILDEEIHAQLFSEAISKYCH